MDERERLAELVERCEKASGPDRELDADIFRALGMPLPEQFAGHPISLEYDEAERAFTMPLGDMRVRYEQPAYTASIDAAMSLVQPNWWMNVSGPMSPAAYGYSREDQRRPRAGVEMLGAPYSAGARATTHALALTAACLRARAVTVDADSAPA